MPNVHFRDWGLIPYEEGWKKQQQYYDKVLQAKRQDKACNYLVFCEHPHVYTLGKSGDEHNLLMNHIQLSAKDATFYKVDRGGDITYHGPGQIVGYPIINLAIWKFGVKEYIHRLEESIIQTLQNYDIKAERLNDATGVWLDVGTPMERKICAMGVKVSRHITMHGFAFNINTDLKYFDYINPCGFKDKGVTSLAQELGKDIDIKLVKQKLLSHIASQFKMQLQYE
ncbi:lipoyl(octanoyl) transferase [Balneicella halophila]|uniref:Octanoyltransferase n=1 Tax=Balneicella halophila TaxID=1537566 RepID=A0A7L4UNS2_BALHA|nr:lipoyl(octanoyl) transferase LipB [Balneicella halophila]PVX50738.1 lipoyl(octanoyl) transferase [Balneicella halophila]